MKSMRLGLWLLLLTTSLSALAPQPQIKDVFAIRNQLRESYRALYTQPFSQAGVEHFNQTNEQLAR